MSCESPLGRRTLRKERTTTGKLRPSVQALDRGIDPLALHLDGVEVDADALAVYDEGELAGFELAGQESVRGAVLQGLESLDDAVYEINGFGHTSILSGAPPARGWASHSGAAGERV